MTDVKNTRGVCAPLTVLLNPLKLAPEYRDFWGDMHSKYAEATDAICEAECYIPRVYHAPDNQTELAGVAANSYLEYILPIPAGSFILGYLHTTTGLTGAGPVEAGAPPPGSGFTCQITDIKRNYKFFQKPVPETYFLQNATQPNDYGIFAGGRPYIACPSPRLLPAPYPITPPGELLFEFWNTLASTNVLVQLSLLVAVPIGAN